MARAESTPNPVVVNKRMIDLSNLNQDIENKKKAKRSLPKQLPQNSNASFGQDSLMKEFNKINSNKNKISVK